MKTSDELLERVFDVIESLKAQDVDVISIVGLEHLIGTRAAFRELVRDLAASEVGS